MGKRTLFLLPVAAGAIQTWLAQPRYQEVNPGGAIDVPCRVANKEGECRWEKSGNPIGIFPGKYEWSGSPGDGDCTLRVINASLEYDDGIWQCQVGWLFSSVARWRGGAIQGKEGITFCNEA